MYCKIKLCATYFFLLIILILNKIRHTGNYNSDSNSMKCLLNDNNETIQNSTHHR